MIRIGSIVLRVDDLQRQTEFWEAALGYVRRDSGESDDFVLLGPPDGAPEVWSVYGSGLFPLLSLVRNSLIVWRIRCLASIIRRAGASCSRGSRTMWPASPTW